MVTESSLFKRIKRHVIGRELNFFAATSPGFEPVCLQELLKLQPGARQADISPGGVEFKGRLDLCYQANLNLRSANRILMRIEAFRSSSFRQLEKYLRDLPWELYLHPGSFLNVHVTTKHCRLHHSDAIAERFQKALAIRLSRIIDAEPTDGVSSAPQNIYVRGLDDRFTVSIDSSGELLYKRGLKKHTGRAPLRETIAATALLLAGYDGRHPLLDPMCGSGTFSLEAALMAKHIPAGWYRDFAFTRWPSFLDRRWNYIKNRSASAIVGLEQPMIFASDKDPEACQKLESCVQMHDLTDAVRVQHRDFFDLDPKEISGRTGIICLNPPYGRRLGGRKQSEKLFAAICDRLKQAYRGWKLVLFVPGSKLASTIPFEAETYPVLHGGLKLALRIGKIQ